MISPPYLNKGDKVSIISSARKISYEELLPSIKILTNWNLEVVVGENLFQVDHQMAGTPEQRVLDMQSVINNPSIKAVFMARGGYGTVQIIDKINFYPLLADPKWFCGFSDVTVLHNHLHNLGIKSLHSTMPVLFEKSTQTSLQSLYNSLFGINEPFELQSNPLNKEGLGIGNLVGGNLSLIVSMIGTSSDIQTDGKILFLEDIDEYIYHIDRMMFQLSRAGKLDKLKGLIIGQMTDLKDNIVPFGKSVYDIVLDLTKNYNYPVCFNFPSGHSVENLALKLGETYQLEVNQHIARLEPFNKVF